jgi:hypothetical protein
MSIQILDAHAVSRAFFFVDQGCDATGARKAEVIEDHDPADGQSRPDPVEYVFARLIDVDINVAEAEPMISDFGTGGFREDPAQNPEIRQSEFRAAFLDYGDGRIGMFAPAVTVSGTGLDNALEGVTKVHCRWYLKLLSPTREETARPAPPSSDFQHIAIQWARLRHQVPQFPAAVKIDKGVISYDLMS